MTTAFIRGLQSTTAILSPSGVRAVINRTSSITPQAPVVSTPPPPPSDTVPDAFDFGTVTDVVRGSLRISSQITPVGYDAPSTISVTNGEYQLDNGTWTTVDGTITPGQKVRVRHNAAANFLNNVQTALTIGGVTGTFTSTTTAAPVISLTTASVTHTEGNSGSTTFVFNVGRTGVDLADASSASWAVTGRGANPVDAADFVGNVLPSGTVNFAANATTATISFAVAGDTTIEPDEDFTLTISNPTGATIGTATATGTIINDDVAPTLSGMVAMGDSWTAPASYSQYLDDWSAANPSIPFHRVATGGWKISDLQANISAVAAYNPALVTILIGLNDLGNYAGGESAWLTALQNLVSAIKAAIPGVRVAVATVPAAHSNVANHNTRRAIVNPQIRSGVGVWHDAVIPIGDWITDADAGNGVTATSYYSTASPGHPTGTLQAVLGQIYTAVLNPFFANSTATSPSAFSFADQPGALFGASYTRSTVVPITGMKLGQAATAVGTGAGTFQSVRNGPIDTADKTVFNGDWPAASVTASMTVSPPTAVSETITIGTTAGTFTVTTGPVASDDFNRVDGALGTTPVGGLNWSGSALISGNKVVFGQKVNGYAVVDTGMQDVDFSMDATLAATGIGTTCIIVGGTKVASGGTQSSDFTEHYTIDLAGGNCTLHTTGGAQVGLFTFTGLARGATYSIRVVSQVSTRTITLYVNGAQVGTGTYANDPNWIPDGTWIGAYEQNQNAGNMIDNLSIKAPLDGYDVIALFGDSYTVGIFARAGGDTVWPGSFQFRSNSSDPNYRTIDSNTTPYSQQIGADTSMNPLSPAEYFAKAYYERTGRKCLIVPFGLNGSSLCGSGIWQVGSFGHENLVAQVNAAVTAAKAAYPDSRFVGFLQWLGTNDVTSVSGNPTTYSRANFLSRMNAAIADYRSRITGAASAWFMLGGMLPETWGNSQGSGSVIEFALRDVHKSGTNIYFAPSPTGWIDTGVTNLHPTLAANRLAGAAWDAILADTTAPTINNGSSYTFYQGQKAHVVLKADRYVSWSITGADKANWEIVEQFFPWGNGLAVSNTLEYILRYVGDGVIPSLTTQNITLNAKAGNGKVTTKALTMNMVAAYGSTTAPGNVAATVQTPDLIQLGNTWTDNANVPISVDLPLGAGLNLIKFGQGSATKQNYMTANGILCERWIGLDTDGQQVFAVTVPQAGTYKVRLFNDGGVTTINPNFGVVSVINSKATYSGTPQFNNASPSSSAASSNQTIGAGGLIISMGYAQNGDTLTAPSTYLRAPAGGWDFYVAVRTTSGTIQLNGIGQSRGMCTLALDKAT